MGVREGGGEVCKFTTAIASKGTEDISIQMAKGQNVVTALQTKHSREKQKGWTRWRQVLKLDNYSSCISQSMHSKKQIQVGG